MTDFNPANFNTRPNVVGAQPTSNGFNNAPPQAQTVQQMQNVNNLAFIPRAVPQPLPQPQPMAHTPTLAEVEKAFTSTEPEPLFKVDSAAEVGRALVNGFNRLPSTIEEAKAYAKFLSYSLLVPVGLRSTDTDDHSVDVFLIIAAGLRFDLPPEMALRAFYVVSGRVDMYVKAKAGICIKYGSWTYSVEQKPGYYGVTYTGYRKDRPNEPHSVTYSTADAQLRNLVAIDQHGGIRGLSKWADKWPDMIRTRALGRFLDEVFPDVIGGYSTKEEMEDIEAPPLVKEISEEPKTLSLKETLSKTRRTKKVVPTEEALPAPEAEAMPEVQMPQAEPALDPNISPF